MSVRIARTFLLIALAAGCSKDSGTRPEAERTKKSTKAADHDDDKHAASGVEPGSHEDWCGEHEVPESQCTRCDPELIPAFKATNDWCEEHQLPLSQDKIHDPDLVITRPPKGS
jgi:hypothetical protein